jgi:hypothetical protein
MKINLLFILLFFALITSCKEETPPVLEFEGRVVLAGTNRSPLGKPLTVYLIRKEREKAGFFYPIDSLKTDSNGYFKKSFIVDRQYSEYKLTCEKLSGYDELTQLVPTGYGLNKGEILVQGYAVLVPSAYNKLSADNDILLVQILPDLQPFLSFQLQRYQRVVASKEAVPANVELKFRAIRYGISEDSVWYFNKYYLEDKTYDFHVDY